MKDQNILVLHALCSFLGAGNNRFAKRHCCFEKILNQIDFLLLSSIHSLGVEKKTTYLADTSGAIPICLCENKDPPQLWAHPE